MVPKIQDYAAIGDCRTAALVSLCGSVDWLCWPRFDSPAIFAALLDRDKGGHWSITPTSPCRFERRYIENTNVLETRFLCASRPAVLPALGERMRAAIERSVEWWQQWAARSSYQGPYREMVTRSALAMKLLA